MANEKQMNEKLIEELDKLLEELDNEDAMEVGVADGFLTAYALNPEHPSKHDMLPYVFSQEGDPASLPEDDRILELLELRFKEIQAALAAKGGLDPIIFPLLDDNDKIITNEDGLEAIEPWASGFLFGMKHWPENLLESEEVTELAVPIIRNLTPESFSSEEEAEEFIENFRTGEMPKNLEDALHDVVKAVYELKLLVDPNKPVVREEPRVGRNDPCPCGSGKKYKQCCGKKA